MFCWRRGSTFYIYIDLMPGADEFLKKSISEWLRLLPFLGVLALLGYLAVRPFLPKKKRQKDSLINLKIQKENPKVVNEINIEDLCLTKAYCRCWRSKTVRRFMLLQN
ncbi:cdgsh iron-sulfur domain-containing protein 2 [Limosa lapponica baueri]|uniref:Cdgsh iron-sulfur domain-containing protein 2 n=1 Tax=Limosa lapponica baueri TaxID=1758121 RepID=A0A2I0T112_LIMLA|nr:cdgsh iron-sulfur domain-containing protein 2 [Limosa lapponica baueri]